VGVKKIKNNCTKARNEEVKNFDSLIEIEKSKILNKNKNLRN